MQDICKYGKSALLQGQIDVVKLLLDHSEDKNIDLNATTYSLGRTAFMIACGEGHKAVVKLLLDYSKDKNIDLNAKTNYGGTVFQTQRCSTITFGPSFCTYTFGAVNCPLAPIM